ncbi:MAG: lycopene cyclase domain-containing protein [Candidatus Anstonellaceae archaeon]
MTWYYYTLYLAFVFFSSLLIAWLAKVKIDFRRFALAVAPVALVFLAWDIFAVERGHWKFGLEYMLGIVVANQPIEEVLFFVVIPLFYVVVWEVVKKKC